MEKIVIIHNCFECQYDSGADCGHPYFEHQYPNIPGYPNVSASWCPLTDWKRVKSGAKKNAPADDE